MGVKLKKKRKIQLQTSQHIIQFEQSRIFSLKHSWEETNKIKKQNRNNKTL